MSHDDERLRQELAKAREEICRLQEENGRLKAILGEFSVKAGSANKPPTANVQPAPRPPSTKPPTPPRDLQIVADKRIQFFRALFRDRDDVYAVRWENKKGKSGYSPACAQY